MENGVWKPDCKHKSCVVTVEARDSGRPFPLSGRAYVTVTLIDENDHDPTVTFRYANSGRCFKMYQNVQLFLQYNISFYQEKFNVSKEFTC